MMILGNAQLAKDQVRHMPEVAQHMEEVIQAANRVSTLTAELLSFAHPAPLALKAMSLDKALLGLEDILTPTISQDVHLKIQFSKTPKVNLDPGQIEQAVVHLAINAVEAMPKGGELLIETGKADLNADDAAKLQMNVLKAERHDGEFAMIKIRDGGTGISEEDIAHIYEPFFTTKPNKENAGLGLSTVYSIIDQHNGHILIDSTPEVGTTFRIYLPVLS
jgi:signal transduction histidine kinase